MYWPSDCLWNKGQIVCFRQGFQHLNSIQTNTRTCTTSNTHTHRKHVKPQKPIHMYNVHTSISSHIVTQSRSIKCFVQICHIILHLKYFVLPLTGCKDEGNNANCKYAMTKEHCQAKHSQISLFICVFIWSAHRAMCTVHRNTLWYQPSYYEIRAPKIASFWPKSSEF